MPRGVLGTNHRRSELQPGTALMANSHTDFSPSDDIEVPNCRLMWDSWARSACYPRAILSVERLPLHAGRRINTAKHPPLPVRKASTLLPTAADRPERTHARLQLLWGRPPQSNTHDTPYQMPMPSCVKVLWGSSVLPRGSSHLHEQYNFAGSMVETAPKSLRCSCRSELTRQGISLPLGTVIVTAAVYRGLGSLRLVG